MSIENANLRWARKHPHGIQPADLGAADWSDEAALAAWQRVNGLVPDGWIGPKSVARYLELHSRPGPEPLFVANLAAPGPGAATEVTVEVPPAEPEPGDCCCATEPEPEPGLADTAAPEAIVGVDLGDSQDWSAVTTVSAPDVAAEVVPEPVPVLPPKRKRGR